MRYPKAPITEAVMDIRVLPRGDLDVGDFGPIAVGTDFSEIGDQFSVTGAIAVGAPAAQAITPVKEGIQFSTKTHDRIFQAQRGGWAFNKLAPYESWEKFSTEGQELWKRYRQVARPASIVRVALRYINRLDIPVPFADFKEYLLTVPEIAPKLPQGLSGFLMQLHIPQPDIDALAVLNIAMMPPIAPNICSILLDIDVFKEGNVAQTEDELWRYFSILREKKNFIFESSITDTMRGRFQ